MPYKNCSNFCTLILSTFLIGCLISACQKQPDEPPDAQPQPASNLVKHGDRSLYLNGTNIAWFNFAKDFGLGLNEKKLHLALQELQIAGANSIRWWLHTDGAYTPQWTQAEGGALVSSPGERTIKDMQRALDIAAEYDILIVFSVWSFDMLYDNDYRKPPTQDNYRLLTEDRVLQSYIDNALVPMVRALNGHPQLLAWELFNEPENMTEPWFPQQKQFYGGPVPTLERLQRVQALMAAAIHKTARAQNQQALVTTGSKSLAKYNSDIAGGINLYRDDRLIAAADGDTDAVLDFYAPHYYNNENRNGAWSPFHRHISYWQVDKPVVIGEFHVEDLENAEGQRIKGKNLCKALMENGYAGGWAWQWIQHEKQITFCVEKIKR